MVGGAVWLAVALLPPRDDRPGTNGVAANGPAAVGMMPGMVLVEPPVAAPQISFSDGAGTSLSLEDFRGRVVLVNLWATWCAPCVREMPSLDRLQARLGGADFQVVALSIDRDGAAAIEPFYAAHGISHLPVYVDPRGAAPRALRALGLPTSVLIDRDGRLLARYEGAAEWDSPEAVALIQRYL